MTVQHSSSRPPSRQRDAGLALAGFGALVLLPPFVNLFVGGLTLWGIPLEVAYLFGVWLALVAGAFALSRRAARAPAPGGATGQGDRRHAGADD